MALLGHFAHNLDIINNYKQIFSSKNLLMNVTKTNEDSNFAIFVHTLIAMYSIPLHWQIKVLHYGISNM